MIKTVIFDFGDTLVLSKNKPSDFFISYKEALKKNKLFFNKKVINGAYKITEAKWKSLTEKEKQKLGLFEQIFVEAIGVKPSKKMCLSLAQDYYAFRTKNDSLMSNALKTLKELKKKKLILGVITNTKTDANYKLAKKLKILKYFKYFLMSHKEKTIKSELGIFYTILNKINKNRKHKILPTECLMVGNNLNEDTAASQIGMKTAILTKRLCVNKKKPFFEPDYYINDLKELISLIDLDKDKS